MNTYTGLQYLKIDIANCMGYDKLQFADRLAWVDEFEDVLEELVDVADKPFQYLAAIQAYRDTQAGKPTGHLVGFDSCASGLQMMAAMTGCKVTAKNTGLIGDKRMDMYAECTNAMSSILGSDVNVERKRVKDAQMPHFYGSRAKPKEVFGEDTPEYFAFRKANYAVAPGGCDMLEILMDSVDPEATRYAWDLPDGYRVDYPTLFDRDAIIEIDELDHASMTYRYAVNVCLNEALALGCTKKNKPVMDDPSIAANTVHSVDGMVVRELVRRCSYNQDQLLAVWAVINDALQHPADTFIPNHRIDALAHDSGFFSLVGVEYITYANVFQFSPEYLEKTQVLIDELLKRPSFEVITVHDDFKAHPNYVNWVRQTYIDIMAEIADSNMLEFLLAQIRGRNITITKDSHDLGDEIRQSEYALS